MDYLAKISFCRVSSGNAMAHSHAEFAAQTIGAKFWILGLVSKSSKDIRNLKPSRRCLN